ncbi:MAG: hypothetical protein V7636_795, partial [Actinomycetota bacterium]
MVVLDVVGLVGVVLDVGSTAGCSTSFF